ncbi:MAG: hypothetical protein WA632_01700 [Gallionella sp.]
MPSQAPESPYDGIAVWKCPYEYFYKGATLYGLPYYLINEVEQVYYLWELDPTTPESRCYAIIASDTKFAVMFDLGMAKAYSLPKPSHLRPQ